MFLNEKGGTNAGMPDDPYCCKLSKARCFSTLRLAAICPEVLCLRDVDSAPALDELPCDDDDVVDEDDNCDDDDDVAVEEMEELSSASSILIGKGAITSEVTIKIRFRAEMSILVLTN